MTLDTMEPEPTWNAAANAETVATFERHADGITVRVWGGDWCGDCRAVLPAFAAALEAAGVPESAIKQYPVNRDKIGELTEEYGIEYIPTIVVERDGEELVRFVEEEDVPAATYLADRLREIEASA